MQTIMTLSQPKKLLDPVRDKIRFKHYSLSTEKTYIAWIKQFILHHGKRHSSELGAADVEVFLTHLNATPCVQLKNSRVRLDYYSCCGWPGRL
jgi:hypothetical protein